MWTTRRRRAAHTTRSRRAGAAVASLACCGLAACTATGPPSPASTASAGATTEPGTVAPFPESGRIDAGTYLVTGYTVPFEIEIPDGWETFDGASLGKDDPNPDLPNSWNVAVSFYPVTHVPTDACAWKGALVQIGPTTEAFVDAMAAQASTVSTPPVEVVVGDYTGLEFEHAPAGDVDLASCDMGMLCIYTDSEQGCNGPGYSSGRERETYRTVDLNGERAVIALYHEESIDPALREEARAVFDSIAFVGPDE